MTEFIIPHIECKNLEEKQAKRMFNKLLAEHRFYGLDERDVKIIANTNNKFDVKIASSCLGQEGLDWLKLPKKQ
jgi:hypothetical protein